MFERFTDRARRVLVIAQEEARTLEHTFIRPEHLLLGLARGDGVASTALSDLGLRYAAMRQRVAEAVASVPSAGRLDKVPFSPQAKKTLELSLREALRLGHNYIGTEHILLGLLRAADETDTKDNRVKDLVGDLAGQLRARIMELVSAGGAQSRLPSPAVVDATNRARQLAGQTPMTTGHLLTAVMADPESQASKALIALGVSPGSLAEALAAVALAGTSDAVPGPVVEIRVGDVTTRVDDPAVTAVLRELTTDEVTAALRRALGLGGGQEATGSEG